MAAMADERQVSVTRIDTGVYEARNARGGTLRFGSKAGDDFTPVELLLAALAGCSAVDIDVVTSRRAEPTRFDIDATGEVIRDEAGNHLKDLALTFHLGFPAGADGDRARMLAPAAARASHDRSCTVSRTVELGTPVAMQVQVDET